MGRMPGPRREPRPLPREETEIQLDAPALRVAAPISLRIDDAAAPIYSVGQVSELLGVQVAFLRRLDSEQLVSPSRSEGGQRRYSREEIERVWRVAGLAGEGITLTGIKRIFELEGEVSELRREIGRLRAHDGEEAGRSEDPEDREQAEDRASRGD